MYNVELFATPEKYIVFLVKSTTLLVDGFAIVYVVNSSSLCESSVTSGGSVETPTSTGFAANALVLKDNEKIATRLKSIIQSFFI